MKTAAIIASLTVVGSLAFAAGKGDVPPPRVASYDNGAAKGDSPDVAASTSCEPTEGIPWFSPIFRPVVTGGNACQSTYSIPATAQPWKSADVNSDGIEEYLAFSGNYFVLGSQPRDGWILANSIITSELSGTYESLVTVLNANGIAAPFMAQYPGTTQASISSLGLRDMDGDGDLDLVVLIDRFSGNGGFEQLRGWFQNTGYEKAPPPLAADLNKDGNIDGIDLGLLLAAWGS